MSEKSTKELVVSAARAKELAQHMYDGDALELDDQLWWVDSVRFVEGEWRVELSVAKDHSKP